MESLGTSFRTNLFKDNDASVQASMMESLGTKKIGRILKIVTLILEKLKSLNEKVSTSKKPLVRNDQVEVLKFATSSRKKTEISMKSMLGKLENNKKKSTRRDIV